MAEPFARPSKITFNQPVIAKDARKIIPDIVSENAKEWKEGDVCTISEKDYNSFPELTTKFGDYHPNMKFIIISTFIASSGRKVAVIQLYNSNDSTELLSDERDNVDRAKYIDNQNNIRFSFLKSI